MDGNTRIFELTCDQLVELISSTLEKSLHVRVDDTPTWAHGLKGLAEGLNCGMTKAQEIKNSHIIDEAIEYCGKSYRVNIEKARELLNKHNRKKR